MNSLVLDSGLEIETASYKNCGAVINYDSIFYLNLRFLNADYSTVRLSGTSKTFVGDK